MKHYGRSVPGESIPSPCHAIERHGNACIICYPVRHRAGTLAAEHSIPFSTAEIDMHGSLFSEYRFTAIDSDINSLFGRRLRFLREANGFQRDDFALRIDVSSFELDELEAGRMEADLVMLHVVSLALCLPLPELLRGL